MTKKNKEEQQVKRIASIGGQALMEGVMMKSPDTIAMAVRKEDGTITTDCKSYTPWSEKHKFMGWPIVRGCVGFVDSLVTGMKAMTFSTEALDFEDEEPSKFELWLSEKLGKGIDQIVIGVAVVLAIVLSVGLFIALPSFLGSIVARGADSAFVTNLAEGLFRMVIFLGYLILISKFKDMKRVFMYHGAEHKTIACYESELPLTVENAQKMDRLHARCGTNYMFLVMLVSILFFSLLGFNGHWALKILLRILCLPAVAGISYEVLRAASKSDALWARIARWPGLKLQLITTSEPDPDMLEVAIVSFNLALDSEAFYKEHPEYRPEEAKSDIAALTEESQEIRDEMAADVVKKEAAANEAELAGYAETVEVEVKEEDNDEETTTGQGEATASFAAETVEVQAEEITGHDEKTAVGE